MLLTISSYAKFQKSLVDAKSVSVHAVPLAPNWGKAYARLGAAQQAIGLLLDAAESYRAALAAEESFDGCRNAYKKLKQSKRFCKLELIRQASNEAEEQSLQVWNRVGHVIEVPDEANDPFNAVAAVNDQQKESLTKQDSRWVCTPRWISHGESEGAGSHSLFGP